MPEAALAEGERPVRASIAALLATKSLREKSSAVCWSTVLGLAVLGEFWEKAAAPDRLPTTRERHKKERKVFMVMKVCFSPIG